MKRDRVASQTLRIKGASRSKVKVNPPVVSAQVRNSTWVAKAARAASGDSPEEAAPAVQTSVRVPASLHEAATEVVDAGWAPSITDLVNTGLRTSLGSIAESAAEQEELESVWQALAEHYAEHPEAEPSLATIVKAAAQQDGHSAAEHPDLIVAAIEDLGDDDVFVEDVLAWVKGALHASEASAAS